MGKSCIPFILDNLMTQMTGLPPRLKTMMTPTRITETTVFSIGNNTNSFLLQIYESISQCVCWWKWCDRQLWMLYMEKKPVLTKEQTYFDVYDFLWSGIQKEKRKCTCYRGTMMWANSMTITVQYPFQINFVYKIKHDWCFHQDLIAENLGAGKLHIVAQWTHWIVDIAEYETHTLGRWSYHVPQSKRWFIQYFVILDWVIAALDYTCLLWYWKRGVDINVMGPIYIYIWSQYKDRLIYVWRFPC